MFLTFLGRRGIIEDSGPVANRRQSGGSAFGRYVAAATGYDYW